jgi:cyclopropane fatty-acyl-phospholipid synthase-like methyltransferase
MAKGLLKYAKKEERQKDPTVAEFVSYTKPGKLLMIGSGIAEDAENASAAGFRVTAVDADYTGGSRNIDFRTDFFTFAKGSEKDAFDIVIDNGFCQTLKKSRLNRFFRTLSKLLRHNGVLFTKAFSDQDSYAREHCPKRKWTMIRQRYNYFFSSEELRGLMRKHGFEVISHTQVMGEHRCHAVEAKFKMTKL